MHVKATQENFAKGLQMVSRVATTRSSLPILANILVATESGRLKLAATDLEIGVTTWLGAKVSEEGAITLPARLLVDVVANTNNTTLDLQLKGTELTLSSEQHTAVIRGVEATDFPLIPKVEVSDTVSLPSAQFRQGLAAVAFAAALDDTRPVLNGVLVKASGNSLILAATDSYRLAERVLSFPQTFAREVAGIVPARTVTELIRILPNTDEMLTLKFAPNQLALELDSMEIVSRLIEGNYPDYRQILPTATPTVATLERKELTSAVKMASLFARDSANNIKVTVTPPTGLTVQAVSATLGQDTASLPAQVSGEAVEIAFNARYLQDALSALEGDTVRLELTGADRPGILKPEKDDGYFNLVMPLRTE